MKRRGRLALLVLLGVAAASCARSDAATVPVALLRADGIPGGQAPAITLPPAAEGTAGGPFVIAASGSITPRSPSGRVARVNLTVTNTSTTPQLLSATQFTTTPAWVATETPAAIRDTTLLPGQVVTGAVAWRASADATSSVTVNWAPPGSVALWSAPVKLEEGAPDGFAVRARIGLLEAVRANVRAVRYDASFASSVAFRGYYGSEWLVRVLATVTNTGRVPISVTRAQFEASDSGSPLTDLSSAMPAGTPQPYYYRQNYTYCSGSHPLAATTVIEPGQSVTGSVCWTTAPGAPQPASPEITLRIPGVAASVRTVPTVAGSP